MKVITTGARFTHEVRYDVSRTIDVQNDPRILYFLLARAIHYHILARASQTKIVGVSEVRTGDIL